MDLYRYYSPWFYEGKICWVYYGVISTAFSGNLRRETYVVIMWYCVRRKSFMFHIIVFVCIMYLFVCVDTYNIQDSSYNLHRPLQLVEWRKKAYTKNKCF